MTSNKANFIEYENVNGVLLTLDVDKGKGTSNSRQFTISYKSKETKSSWPKISLLLAVLFNIFALFYISISITVILIIVIVLSFLVFFWITHSVQSETLLVIPTVGIQSSVKYVFGREDNFIPWSSIDDVIINEVIKMNRVLYFLTVLVKVGNQSGQDIDSIKLVPLFKYTKPRLFMLEKIYSELQSLLADSQAARGDRGSGDIG